MPKPYGIPTTYAGVRYRSRLEARWAAFFSSIGWRFIYEPEDFGGWIPDFALVHKGGPTYVEIKPLYQTDYPVELAEELEAIRLPREREVLLLGCELGPPANCDRDAACRIGWFARSQRQITPCEAVIYFSDATGFEFCSSDGDWTGRQSGIHNKWFGIGFVDGQPDQTGIFENLWNEAGNTVQWNAR